MKIGRRGGGGGGFFKGTINSLSALVIYIELVHERGREKRTERVGGKTDIANSLIKRTSARNNISLSQHQGVTLASQCTARNMLCHVIFLKVTCNKSHLSKTKQKPFKKRELGWGFFCCCVKSIALSLEMMASELI